MKFPKVTTCIFLLLVPQLGHAWSREGHEATALVAQQILMNSSSPKAVQALKTVTVILGATSFEQASTWPDQVKSESRACSKEPYVKDPNHGDGARKGTSSAICDAYRYTSSWHFINSDNDRYDIDRNARDRFKGDMAVLANGLSHILKGETTQIDGVTSYTNWKNECMKKADHSSNSCKKEALEFLIHLIGDIHQPLHAGAVCDIGGNTQQITFFGQAKNPGATWCKPTDPPSCSNHELHEAWDEGLIRHGFKERHIAGVKEYVAFLMKGVASKKNAAPCVALAPDAKVEVDAPNGPVDWINESLCYVKQAYTFPDDPAVASNQAKSDRDPAQAKNFIPNRCRKDKELTGPGERGFGPIAVGEKYYRANIDTIDERIYWGGHRLANLLVEIYGGGDKAPGF